MADNSFTATYGVTTDGQMRAAFEQGKKFVLVPPEHTDAENVPCTTKTSGNDWFRITFKSESYTYAYDSNSGWGYEGNASVDYQKPAGGIPYSDLGDSSIQAINDAKEIFDVIYGETPFDDIRAAYNAKKLLRINHAGDVYYLFQAYSTEYTFLSILSRAHQTYGGTNYLIRVNRDNEWGYNEIDTLSLTSADNRYLTKDNLVIAMLDNGLYTPNLATDSWSTISAISASGNAANYYAVGDCKAVELNGTMGTLSLDTTLYVYILGFDHNAEVEGHGITFGGFKTSAGNDAVDVCLVDSGYQNFTIDGSKHFNMNHWGETYHGPKGDEDRSYNYGGWAGSDMRYDILGSTNRAPSNYGEVPAAGRTGQNPTSTCTITPVANTLMSCLPVELRKVMKPITKYSDNVGGGDGNVEANVTATVDYLPLMAEYEIFGSNLVANTYETAHQAQYTYYNAGNSKIKYQHTNTSSVALVWERSVSRGDSAGFCCVHGYGNATSAIASDSRGVSPLILV